jgi:hypothetical protein
MVKCGNKFTYNYTVLKMTAFSETLPRICHTAHHIYNVKSEPLPHKYSMSSVYNSMILINKFTFHVIIH